MKKFLKYGLLVGWLSFLSVPVFAQDIKRPISGDVDKDGRLSKVEFSNLMKPLLIKFYEEKKLQLEMELRFRLPDKNMRELFRREMGKSIDIIFEDTDADDNGYLTYKEIEDYHYREFYID